MYGVVLKVQTTWKSFIHKQFENWSNNEIETMSTAKGLCARHTFGLVDYVDKSSRLHIYTHVVMIPFKNRRVKLNHDVNQTSCIQFKL